MRAPPVGASSPAGGISRGGPLFWRGLPTAATLDGQGVFLRRPLASERGVAGGGDFEPDGGGPKSRGGRRSLGAAGFRGPRPAGAAGAGADAGRRRAHRHRRRPPGHERRGGGPVLPASLGSGTVFPLAQVRHGFAPLDGGKPDRGGRAALFDAHWGATAAALHRAPAQQAPAGIAAILFHGLGQRRGSHGLAAERHGAKKEVSQHAGTWPLGDGHHPALPARGAVAPARPPLTILLQRSGTRRHPRQSQQLPRRTLLAPRVSWSAPSPTTSLPLLDSF